MFYDVCQAVKLSIRTYAVRDTSAGLNSMFRCLLAIICNALYLVVELGFG
jgi:hypothetical protein